MLRLQVVQNPFLSGLVGDYSPDEIRDASEEVLGFPFLLVSTGAEVTKIVGYLKEKRK